MCLHYWKSCVHRAELVLRDLLQVKINSWLIYPFYCFLRIFRSFVFMILKRTFEECVSLFSYQRSFCIAVCLKQLCYYIMSFPACQELFPTFFEVVFVSLLQQLWYLITSNRLLSRTFSFLFYSSLSDATRLCYHESFQMSRTFFHFFPSTQKEGFEPSHGANRLYP